MQKYSNKHMFNYLRNFNGQTVTEEIIVLNKIYYNENGDNVFGVYEVAIEDEYIDSTKIFSVVGNVDLQVDKTYRVKGEVYYDEKYGFEIINPSVVQIFPKHKETIKRLLSILHGIGPARALMIVNEFGDESLNILLNDPQRIVQEINGIGPKTIAKASKHLQQEQEKFKAVESLSKAGLSPKVANNLLSGKAWKETYKIISENPYQLIDKGILTFKKADEVACQLGLKPSNINRLKSGIIYALQLDAVNNGHCFCYMNRLLEYALEILTVFLPENINDYITVKNGSVDCKFFSIEKSFTIKVFNQYKDSRPYKKNLITGRTYSRTVFKMYEPSLNDLKETLIALEHDNLIHIDNEKVYLKIYEDAENNIVKTINNLKSTKNNKFSKEEAQNTLDFITRKNHITLSPDQNDAVINMAISDGGMHILLGSAGCGKTFCLNIFIKLYKALRKIDSSDNEDLVTILAPTGRASKVATASTGIKAYTIHKRCGIQNSDSSHKYEAKNQIDTDIVIIDETSMLDIRLTSALMESIFCNSKVIFVGDIKQLPPIGAGRVLLDIINSQSVDIFQLSTIQRQKEDSGIIYNANKIMETEMIEDKKDCRAVAVNSNLTMSKVIFEDFERNVLKYSIEDVQVISPMWQQENGVHYLNYEIQKRYNPIPKDDEKKKFITAFSHEGKTVNLYLHKNDKVINTKNSNCLFFKRVKTPNGIEYVPNGNSEIANGEIGIVKDIRYVFSEEFFQRIEVVLVKFDDGYAFFYDKPSESYCLLSNLNLAYAITIHKAQGSQWKHVIVAIARQHSIMVTNNLLYTAITRAQESATIVYDRNTFEKGECVFASIDRQTTLTEKLKADN